MKSNDMHIQDNLFCSHEAPDRTNDRSISPTKSKQESPTPAPIPSILSAVKMNLHANRQMPRIRDSAGKSNINVKKGKMIFDSGQKGRDRRRLISRERSRSQLTRSGKAKHGNFVGTMTGFNKGGVEGQFNYSNGDGKYVQYANAGIQVSIQARSQYAS